jgi:hypothetical protein
VLAGVLAALCQTTLTAQSLPAYELPPINYSSATESNQATRLAARLATDSSLLQGPTERDRLRSILTALDISPASQVLVFSKTSLQRRLISPATPRALYFSDDAYLGWVPGGLLELAVTDPALGLAFYRIDTRSAGQLARVERDAECLSCHAGPLTRDWPSLLVRSVFPDETGEPIGRAGGFLVEQDTVISNRWGGWYVTGGSGRETHLGNLLLPAYDPGVPVDRTTGASRTNLAELFNTRPYLRPESDIVALMVLEHQVGMHNRLAEGALQVRKWSHYQRELQRELGEPVSEEPVGTARRVVQGEAGRILEYLLFSDEAALPAGGLNGNQDFQEAFQRNRRVDPAGRSLKDFDLRTRLFQWRCSYLIHSEAFAFLPDALRNEVLTRLGTGLTAENPPPHPFKHLAADERRAIHEILLATHEEYASLLAAAAEPTP